MKMAWMFRISGPSYIDRGNPGLGLHIKNLCKSCFYHIRAIRHIRAALTKNVSPVPLSPLVLIMLIPYLWVSQTLNSTGCNASKTPWLGLKHNYAFSTYFF